MPGSYVGGEVSTSGLWWLCVCGSVYKEWWSALFDERYCIAPAICAKPEGEALQALLFRNINRV